MCCSRSEQHVIWRDVSTINYSSDPNVSAVDLHDTALWVSEGSDFLFDLEDEGAAVVRNVGSYSPRDKGITSQKT
jgi:hypothetical protein